MKRVVYAKVEDWCVLYVDGESVFQGHSIDIGSYAYYVTNGPHKLEVYSDIPEVEEYVMETGEFPPTFVEFKKILDQVTRKNL